MRLQDWDTSDRFAATLIATQRITPQGSPEEVRELMFEINRPGFAASAGQSVGIIAPGDPTLGETEHFRLYSIASLPEATTDGELRFPICVRRCDYIDAYNGERYPGIASHYLCDLRVGERVRMTGPYGDLFHAPDDPEAALILIGAGTGIAPFRAFVKSLYSRQPRFGGRVRLFHGGRTGVDLLYQNNIHDDFALYYDNDTFEAIRVLSARPDWDPEIDWLAALQTRADEMRDWLMKPHTYIYVAGVESIRDRLDAAFAELVGSPELWRRRKAELVAGGRWVELLY